MGRSEPPRALRVRLCSAILVTTVLTTKLRRLRVRRDPALVALAEKQLPALNADTVEFQGASEVHLAELRRTYSQYVELEHMPDDPLAELRETCAKVEWSDQLTEKLVVNVFAGS